MKRVWALAFVAVIALAGATAAQASGTDTDLRQEASLLAQIFSSDSSEAPASSTPEAAPALGVPEPVPNVCLAYSCRQPCHESCQSIGCFAACTDQVACTCGCICG